MGAEPRIAPGGPAEIGRANYAVARMIGAASGGGPPHVFTTLARHRRLFRRWLRFAGALMPGGVLPRADSELVILRVAHNSGSEYEWRHHERLGAAAGLDAARIAAVRHGAEATGWTERQALLLRAADELHSERTLSDALWAELRPLLSDEELIELCLLVGHYEMLAMTLNALAVQPDALPSGPPSGLAGLVQRVAARRRRVDGRHA
ncbi:MAG: carboxymuconolactone decarboxylase family protein [Solirubrobacterales bacterium]